MESILKYLLFAISIVALISGLNVIIGGAEVVPGSAGAVESTVDNELRFFAVYWVAFGLFCFWVGKALATRHSFVPFIALTFFLSGLARLVSVLAIGSPSNALYGAMLLEFFIPVVMLIIYYRNNWVDAGEQGTNLESQRI